MTLPTYAYSASAIGLGGVIRQGNRTTVIPTVASVCLATAGGEASNMVENYDRDGISFTRAQTRVGGYATGRGEGRRHSTFAEVLLLNLKIFDRVSIARMQAVVTSTRDLESGDPRREVEPDRSRFTVKLMYHGLEVDGEAIEPQVDTQLCEAASYRKFHELLVSRRPQMLPEMQGLIDTSKQHPNAALNGPLVAFPGNAKAQSNRLLVPGFGRARFGEILVKPDRQRVTLFRLTLDEDWSAQPATPRRRSVKSATLLAADAQSADGSGGDVSAGDGGSNGVPIWP